MAYAINGKKVSKPWHTVITHYQRTTGRKLPLNSGRRTLAEQWALYRLYKSGRGNLAAYPIPSAPHINFGRANHALDIEPNGIFHFISWLYEHGVAATRPVPGEPWHLQAPRKHLLALAKKIERKRRGK